MRVLVAPPGHARAHRRGRLRALLRRRTARPAHPPLKRAIGNILHYADDGSTPLVLATASANAVAEELFFRGALWSLVAESHPGVKTTLANTAAATRNPALVLAGTATSVLFGLQRISGGILAPALSHLTWSLMLRYLPPLFPAPRRPEITHD